MASFNRVILAGNLTRDPQLSFTSANTPVCKFGLATNRKWRDRDNNQKEEVCFVDLTAFGRQAEVINQYMTKGRSMLIEGRLHFNQWTDKEGKNRTKLEVIVENFTFLGGGERGGGPEGQGGAQRGSYSKPQGGGYNAPSPDEPPIDDAPPPEGAEIPF